MYKNGRLKIINSGALPFFAFSLPLSVGLVNDDKKEIFY